MYGVDNLQALRAGLLNKIKNVEINRKACEQLSVAIFIRQNDYVSTTTLMRLFSLLPFDKHTLSPKVLGMLLKFAGLAAQSNMHVYFQNEMPVQVTEIPNQWVS
ncbi:hypothetical protein [Pedobacter sp. BMA]|uniref:hypothetical protein n=1 Tax=Pedobacter sp. BMA TaxID=1663685 RepID=UPI000649885C|nr:hypothetical protein [Pedobacter sp. BMA]KLT63843.1 hypothetical protein AB669_19075 [Pedobacter sp. BMA]